MSGNSIFSGEKISAPEGKCRLGRKRSRREREGLGVAEKVFGVIEKVFRELAELNIWYRSVGEGCSGRDGGGELMRQSCVDAKITNTRGPGRLAFLQCKLQILKE